MRSEVKPGNLISKDANLYSIYQLHVTSTMTLSIFVSILRHWRRRSKSEISNDYQVNCNNPVNMRCY